MFSLNSIKILDERLFYSYIDIDKINNLNVNNINNYSDLGKQDEEGNSLLMYIISYSKKIDINLIKSLKKEIGLKDNEGRTALLIYLNNVKLENFNINIIELLKDEIDIIDNFNKTCLMYICSNIIKTYNYTILNYFSKQIGLKDKEGKTALMHYVENNSSNINYEIIKFLYKEIGLKDNNGRTVLINYIENNNSNCLNIKLLNSLKDEIDITDDKGNKPIMIFLNKNINYIPKQFIDTIKSLLNVTK